MGAIDQQSEQYRRGQVLGFTMAEIMLVLLFLLLLLLGSQIEKLSEDVETAIVRGTPEYASADNLTVALNELKEKQLVSEERDVEWLSERLVLAAEVAVSTGGDLSSDDIQTIDGLKERIGDLMAEAESVSVENGTLKEELSKAEALQKQLSLDEKLIEIVTDRNITSSEVRQCLLNCGGGPTACWGESLAKPDFIYNVALFDDYVVVSPDTRSVEVNDPDWESLPPEARIEKLTVLKENDFRIAFSALTRHASSRGCVFQTRLVDVNTSGKEIYKQQKKMVDDYTYSSIFRQWVYGDLPE